MSTPFRFGSAISLVALGTAIAGCAVSPRAPAFGGKAGGDTGLATRAWAALAANDVPTAISFAERAVAKTPDDAGYRALLGNAYFAAGRFASAEAAYKDALSIYSEQPTVVLKLALVEIANGKTNEAVALLHGAQSVLDPADYGLALALAGHPNDAVSMLEVVARGQGADGRVRQNLALAHALSGDWTQARIVASQDVPADQLDERIQQWMQLAKPAKSSDQIAALVGVTPAAIDQGQPTRLALRKSNIQVAQTVAPKVAASGPSAEPTAAAALAVAPAPPPANPDRIAATAKAALAPVTMAIVAAATPGAPSTFLASARNKPRPAAARPAKARRVAALASRANPRRGHSNAVVQLGAYGSPQRVNEAWNRLAAKYPGLRGYLPLRAKFVSPKGVFWRLSIQGFDSQREAIDRCNKLRSRGGSCFVRNAAGDAPVQYASR